MSAKPVRLNTLQGKTLTLLQEIAQQSLFSSADPETGERRIRSLPDPHGDHFHIGRSVVLAKDASGLKNDAVLTALARKGLIRVEGVSNIVMTEAGANHDAGMRGKILHGSDH